MISASASPTAETEAKCVGCHIRIPAGKRFCPWGCAEWAASKGDAKAYKRMCAETRATWADRDVE